MASSPRTFDLALWAAPRDRARLCQAVQRLSRADWRVRLLGGERALPAANARVSLALASDRAACDWPAGVLVAPSVGPDLMKRLHAAARATETLVDLRFPLGAGRLSRATMNSYDAIAEQFAEQWFAHPPLRELEHFLRRLRRRSRVLDAGCGPGHHAALLKRAGHDVLGVDFSAGMLHQCRLRASGVRTARMNLEQLDFSDGAFDAIWCAAAILHVPREHLPRLLLGFRRILRAGGVLGLNFQVGRRSELVERGADRRFFEYYADAAVVARQLKAAGFTVESALHGRTRRNTHALDLTLNWSTLYASAGHGPHGRIGSQDVEAEVAFVFRPCEEVDIVDS